MIQQYLYHKSAENGIMSGVGQIKTRKAKKGKECSFERASGFMIGKHRRGSGHEM